MMHQSISIALPYFIQQIIRLQEISARLQA